VQATTAIIPACAGTGPNISRVELPGGPFGDGQCALVEEFRPEVVSFHVGTAGAGAIGPRQGDGAEDVVGERNDLSSKSHPALYSCGHDHFGPASICPDHALVVAVAPADIAE
jgi:hypothetical protein